MRGGGGGILGSVNWPYNEVISHKTLGELRKVGFKLCAVGY